MNGKRHDPAVSHGGNQSTSALGQGRIEGLVRLALDGLERMYDPGREVLFTRRFDRPKERDDHLSLRYTVMCSLGVHDARAAGFATALEPRRLLESGFNQFQGDDIDHLALALWSNATQGGDLHRWILPRLLPQLDDPRIIERSIGRVLAWALTGLVRHEQAGGWDAAVARRADELIAFARERLWCETGRLFHHQAAGSPFSRAQTLFSTQIYWVYAFALYGRVRGDRDAVRIAGSCADRLHALRDRFGGFAWRYNALTGTVVERFPVYAVHQDGMAPMALFELAAADGRDVNARNRENLSWLWSNQLGIPMVDEDRRVIFRAIRRRVPFDRSFRAAGRLAARFGRPGPGELPWFLQLDATCRPYHLGWLLHAFTRRMPRVTPGR